MTITSAICQLRTTDLAESIRFYSAVVGLTLEFQYEDFYAGIRAGNSVFHLKLVDQEDPSIAFVDEGDHFHLYLETDDAAAAADALKRNGVHLVKDVHETAWERESSSSRTIRGTPCTSASIVRQEPTRRGQ
jgi:predicted enzyme related to lactoylglutathione lyase